MSNQDNNPSSFAIPKKIYLIGILTTFTVSQPTFLHTNLIEFIYNRFIGINDLNLSYFDIVLYIAYLFIGVLVGYYSDRIKKRKIFITIGALANIAFFYLMTLVPVSEYWLLLVIRFFQGTATVITWQMLMTLAVDISSEENRGKTLGIFGIFLVIAMAMGSIVGGFLADLGVFIPYYAASIMSVVVFIVGLLSLKEPPVESMKEKIKIINSLKILKTEPALIVSGIFNFVDRLHMGFLIYIIPIYLANVLDVDPKLRGMVLGLHAFPFLLLQYPIGKWSDEKGRYKPLLYGSIFYGVILMFGGFITSLIPFILMTMLLGIGSGFTGPPSMALVGDFSTEGERGRATAFYNFTGNIGIILGPLIAGILLEYSNFIFTFIIAGVIELISLVISMLLIHVVFPAKMSAMMGPRKKYR